MKSALARQDRNNLIEDFRGYVKYVVSLLSNKFNLPPQIQDDLVAAGNLGLVEAAERFDANNGVSFRNYAYFRIRGAIVDHIRLSSDLRGEAYYMAKAIQALEDTKETYCSRWKEQDKRDSAWARLLEFASKGSFVYCLSLQDAFEQISSTADTSKNQEEELQSQQERKTLSALIAKLPAKEKLVIQAYYLEGKSFVEICEENPEFSKSWVSRLHSKALARLKEAYVASEMQDA